MTAAELLAALAEYRAAAPEPVFPDTPEELHLELTWRCNARCVMCDAGRRHAAAAAPELDTNAYARLLDDPLLDRVRSVVISGGEPTLRDDLPQLVALVRARLPQAETGILTNLHDTERLAAQLEAIIAAGGRQRLWFGSSLDGATASVHDAVRGVPGSFARVQRGITLVRERYALPLSLTFTLTEHNWQELAAAYQQATQRECGFGAQVAVARPGLPAPRFSAEALAGIAAQVQDIVNDLCVKHDAFTRWQGADRERHAGLWALLHYWGELPARASGRGSRLVGCPAGKRFIMLDPHGRLYFCPLLKERAVPAATLSAMWQSPAAQAVRADINAQRCPDCWLLCTSLPALTRQFGSQSDAPHTATMPLPRRLPPPAPCPGLTRVLVVRSGGLDAFPDAYSELARVCPAARFTLVTTKHFTAAHAQRYPAIAARLIHQRGWSLLRLLRGLDGAAFDCCVVTGRAWFPLFAACLCRPRFLYRLHGARRWQLWKTTRATQHPLMLAADPRTLPPLSVNPPELTPRRHARRLLWRGLWLVLRRWWLTRIDARDDCE